MQGIIWSNSEISLALLQIFGGGYTGGKKDVVWFERGGEFSTDAGG